MRSLIDVNILIALLDDTHSAHSRAHAWLATARDGIATCAIVENGAFRIMTQASYGGTRVAHTLPIVLDAFRTTTTHCDHQRFAQSISLADPTLFDHSRLLGPRQLTDVYLLGLAVAHHAALVTLDRSIPVTAVRGAKASQLVVL